MTGLLVITPVGLTVLMLRAIFIRLDAILGEAVRSLLGRAGVEDASKMVISAGAFVPPAASVEAVP